MLHTVKDRILRDIPCLLGWNPAATTPAATRKAGVSISEAVAAAAAEGDTKSEAAVAAEAVVAEAVVAPIRAVPVACVCPREPFACEQLAAQHRMSYWMRHYLFAEVLSVFFCLEEEMVDPTYPHIPCAFLFGLHRFGS